MGDQHHQRRARERFRTDVDDAAVATAVPGRRSAIEAARWPDRPLDQIQAWLATARSDVGALRAAVEQADFGAALTRACYLRNVLGAAREMLADRRISETQRRQLEPELERASQAAEPVLMRAPPPLASGEDPEVAATKWRASLGGAVDGTHGLPAAVRARMEDAFVHSFADVRIHHDGVAEASGARALTRGNDVHFAPGAFDLASVDGIRLLAHELTHVVQQTAGGSDPRSSDRALTPEGRAPLEAEADTIAARVAAGGRATTVHGRASFGTQQHDDRDAAIAALAVKLMRRQGLARVVPPPTLLSIVGDRFKVTFERDTEYRFVTVVDYQGPFAHAPAVRLVAPPRWETEDVAWNAQVTEVRRDGLTVDLTGDGSKIITLSIAPEARSRSRVHAIRTELNAMSGDGGSVEVTLPDKPADAPAATGDELAAERTVSVPVALGPDKATLTARRFGDSGRVLLTFDSEHRRASSRPSLLVPFTGKQLAPRIASQSAGSFELDLDGDRKTDIRIVDTIRKPRPIGSKDHPEEVRWHDLEARDADGHHLSSATFVVAGPPVAIPEAMRDKPKTGSPAWTDAKAPPHQGDVAIQRSQAVGTELRIDADGDRRKELVLRFHRDGDDVVTEVVQVATGVSHTLAKRVPLSGNTTWNALEPVVEEAADGHGPMRIELFGDRRMLARSVYLMVHPPVIGKDGMARAHTFVLDGAAETLGFAPDHTSDRVALVGDTRELGFQAGVVGYEAELGELHDRFLFTLEYAPGGLTFAVAGRGERAAVVAGGVRVKPVNPAYGLRRVEAGASRIGFSIDGDDKADVVVYDAIQSAPGVAPSADREHRLTISGPAIPVDHTVRLRCRGRQFEPVRSYDARDEALEREAAGALHTAVAIGQQATEGKDVGLLADQFAAGASTQVVSAGEAGRIPAAMYAAWKTLTADMIALSVDGTKRSAQNEVDLRARAAAAANTLHGQLETVTADATHRVAPEGRSKDTINNYTGDEVHYPYAGPGRTVPGAGAQLAGAISAKNVVKMAVAWSALRAGVERWCATRNTAALGADSDEVKQQRYLAGMARELGEIRSKAGVRRVYATFIADDSYRAEANFHASTPLQLYIWRDGNDWKIRDVTNPEHPFTESADGDGTDVPPQELFDQLDDKKGFPKGLIRFQVPGGPSGHVVCRAKKKWYEWAAEIGLALAAVGFALATFGAGTVAVAGSYVMAASMVAGAVAAGGEIYDDYRHGQLDTLRVLLNVLQIASGVASAGAIVAGNLVKGAVAAANAVDKANWTGRWAKLAKLADKAYVPLIGAAAAADVSTVAVMGVDLLEKLREIDAAGGDEHQRKLAKASLIAQFVVMGGITALSVKGSLPEITHGKVNIVLDRVGGEVVAYAGGVHIGGHALPIPKSELGTAATARWNAPSLEAGVKGPHREWYEKWLVQKEKITFGPNGEPHAKLPEIEGQVIPEGVKEHIEGLARMPEFQHQQRGLAIADEVAALRRISGGLDIDPTSPIWPKEREKLISRLGGGRSAEQLVDRYAAARLGGQSASHAAQRARLTQVLPKEEVERIAQMWPEYEVYVTGQAIAPGKAARATPVGHIEIVVVVPEGTSADLIGAIEQRAKGRTVRPDPDYLRSTPGADPNTTLPLDVKAQTPDQMFGAATARTKGYAPPDMHRIDVLASGEGHAYTRRELEAFQRAGYEFDPATRRFAPRAARSQVPFGAEAGGLRGPNTVIGTPLPSREAGVEVLERLAAGESQALRVAGIEPPHGMDTRLNEWGVGRRSSDGSFVLVQGETGAVNWDALPGIEPVGHSHPLYFDANRKTARYLKGPGGQGSVSFEELQQPGLYADRTHLCPSGSDFAAAARHAGEHVVAAPYVHLGGGRIGNPVPGGNHPQVVFHITGSIPVGMHAPGSQVVVYRARLRATAGGEELGSAWVEAIQNGAITDLKFGEYPSKGPLDPSVRPGMERAPAPGHAATGPHATQVGAGGKRDEYEVALETAVTGTADERRKALGTDPKRGMIEHEAEVGALVEARYGYFRRDPTGAGEWQSVSGGYKGKVFDLVGFPAKAAPHVKLDEFRKSIDSHMLKQIDYVLVDLRNFDAAARTDVKSHVATKWAAQQHRVLWVEP
jgi:hypothetical protein